ncbi:MAG TPA: choice-of-anchor tandem repeat GloVer-containing protein [Terriglobales bacterium]
MFLAPLLASLKARGDAALPSAAMIRVAGNFYGTTIAGGAYGYGSVFRFNPGTGEVTVLYSFEEGAGSPEGSLIRDKKHNLYGTTVAGGITLVKCYCIDR